MAADIFGQAITGTSGVFSSSSGSMTIAGKNTANSVMLIQDWRVNISQQVQPLYEFGSSRVYWALGHSSGQLTIGRVVSNVDFVGALGGDACDPKTLTIKTGNGVCAKGDGINGEINLTLHNCVLQSVEYSGNNQAPYISENVVIQFSQLSR